MFKVESKFYDVVMLPILKNKFRRSHRFVTTFQQCITFAPIHYREMKGKYKQLAVSTVTESFPLKRII